MDEPGTDAHSGNPTRCAAMYRDRTMPLAILIAATYLAINLALSIWVIREETRGHPVPAGLSVAWRALRYGPPLLGLFYLVTIAGDWPFFLFVIAFFTFAFALLNGLLSTPIRPPKR